MNYKHIAAIIAIASIALLAAAVHAATIGTCFAHDYDQGVFTAAKSDVAVLSTHNGVVRLTVYTIKPGHNSHTKLMRTS